MNIFHYNEKFEYVGQSVARVNPRNPSKFLIPRNATSSIPRFEEGKLTKYDLESKLWYLETIIAENIEDVVDSDELMRRQVEEYEKNKKNKENKEKNTEP
jgi:hypothetical protein